MCAAAGCARVVKAMTLFMMTVENVEGTIVGKCKTPSMFKPVYEFEIGAQADMLAQVILGVVMSAGGGSMYAGAAAGI